MALNPSPLVGITMILLVAGCSVATNIGDLAPASGGTETTGDSPTTTESASSATETEMTGSSGSVTTGVGTIDPPATSSSGGLDDTGSLQPEPQMSVLAIRSGDIPDLDEGGSTSRGSGNVSGSSSGGADDDALYVAVGFFTGTCENPFGDGACAAWRVGFDLDLDQQQPGTYDLAVLNGAFYESDAPDGNDCARGNGSLEGTVIINSIDEFTVEGELQVLDFSPMGTDLTSFSFSAQRC